MSQWRASMRVMALQARLTAGEYTCLYADGMLYDKLSVSQSNPNIEGTLKSVAVSTRRPSLGISVQCLEH